MRDRERRGGPRPDGPSTQEELETRRRRASEEPLDVRLAAQEPVVRVEVRNPIHRTSYSVLFPEYPGRDAALCTCTDFARRGLGSCKHLEAAWTWLEDHPPLPEGGNGPDPGAEPASGLWSAIDRRLEALRQHPPERIGEVERAGTVLFEERAEPVERTERAREEEVGRRNRGRRAPTRSSRARP